MKSERNTTRQKEIIIKKTEAIREGERQNQSGERREHERRSREEANPAFLRCWKQVSRVDHILMEM